MKTNLQNIHKEFVRLGRERNKITYKLLALLPQIAKQRIYERHGYANIYDYAAKIAGLTPGVVSKAIRLEEKIKNKPHLQKAIETQGINKVAIIAGLATKENEGELAEKVENMSKPALQEYSKEMRGKVTMKWQIELDQEMMFMFLKLKKKFSENLSNKECLRKMLESMNEKGKITAANVSRSEKKSKSRPQAKKQPKNPGDFSEISKIPKNNQKKSLKISRYIPIAKKRELPEKCSHQNCHRPAQIIHHQNRFSQTHNHENLQALCRAHHEFVHNGISEAMTEADYQYRKSRKEALL